MKQTRAMLFLASTLLAPAATASDLPIEDWGGILYLNGPSSIAVADLDRDGHQDTAIAAIELGRVLIDFGGPGATYLVLEETFVAACYVRIADINGDGWLDVVGSQRDNANGTVKWWRNPGDAGSWSPVIVTGSDFSQSRSFAVGDLDKDGDADIVVAGVATNLSYLSWYENTNGSGTVWTARDLATGTGSSFLGPHDVVIADFDGDGNADVAAVAYDSDEVAWFRNDGSPHSTGLWTKETIDTSFDGALCLGAADLDADGDVDLVAGAYLDDDVVWYENRLDAGSSWLAHTIATALNGVYTVQPVDLDQDGDLDIVASARVGDLVVWYERNDLGSYDDHNVTTGFDGARSAVAVDFDSDGDLDIVAAGEFDDRVNWYQNFSMHFSAGFSEPDVVEGPPLQPRSVDIADLDCDGDLDIVATEFNTTLDPDLSMWTQGPGGWTKTGISWSLDGATAVRVADVNADGLPDLVAVGSDEDEIGWYWNDGSGSFAYREIASSINGAKDVDTADFDCDGDLDVAAVAYESGEVLWFENDDGAGYFWTPHVINTFETPWALRVGDFDRDGRADLVVVDITYGAVWALPHLDCGTVWGELVIDTTFGGAADVEVGDFNGDGWQDVAVAGASEESITVWFKDPAGWNWEAHQVSSGTPWWGLAVGDLNRDGATDIVGFSNSNLRWWKNNGQGTSWIGQTPLDAALYGTFGVTTADIDADGLTDVVTVGSNEEPIAVYENVAGQFTVWNLDLAPETMGDAELAPVLRILPLSAGISEDPDIELRNVNLRFDDGSGTPLTSAQANATIEAVSVWYDANINGTLDPPNDVPLGGVPHLTLDAEGEMTIPISHGGDNPSIDIAAVYPFFVVVTTTPTASTQSLNTFRVSHQNTAPALAHYFDWPDLGLQPMAWTSFSSSTVTCQASTQIFADGFESGDTIEWSNTVP